MEAALSTDRLKTMLLLLAGVCLGLGLGAHFAGLPDLARTIWVVGVVPVLIALLVEIAGSLRRGEFGLDIVAALSMSSVGGHKFVGRQLGHPVAVDQGLAAGAVLVAVAVDAQLAGYLVMSDPIRESAGDMLAGLRKQGLRRILLATGDREAVAQRITHGLGLDGIRADLSPDQKVLVVLSERKSGPVMMLGDGVNDAPALAAADVGVAMGARGAAASAEAADVVLLVDDLRRLVAGMEIARRSQRIALESVAVGIGASVVAMIVAAFGYLAPVQGAVLQEVIDVAVILNALRALRINPLVAPREAAAAPHEAAKGDATEVRS